MESADASRFEAMAERRKQRDEQPRGDETRPDPARWDERERTLEWGCVDTVGKIRSR